MVADLHVEAARAFGDDFADATQAKDAQALAAYFGRHGEGRLGPFACAQISIRFAEASRGVDQERKRRIGHAIVEHIRGVPDLDAPCLSMSDVDRVEADAKARDHAQVRKGIHERRASAETRRGHDALEGCAFCRKESVTIAFLM